MNAWTRLRRGWIAAFAILLVSSGAHAAETEEALLVVDGAQNPSRIPRSPGSRQISYTMNLEYPARAVGEPQWNQLGETGWVRCRSVDPDQEVANRDWVDFVDGTKTPERTVHQHLTHWFKGNQMIMISLRYYSGTRNGHAKSRPDNTEQRVDLVFDDDHGREMATWLQLDCSN
jgi:hypothetical protein